MSADPAPAGDRSPLVAVERHRVVVVGAGVAALAAALELGAGTVLVDAGLGSGSSPWAQGGMAAAVGPDDTPHAHAEDTVAVAGGIGDAVVAESVTGAAPDVIAWLRSNGARFDTDGYGSLVLGREAGHRARRIVHAHGDATGAEIMRSLVEAVRRNPRLRVQEGVTVLDLVRDEHDERVVGVVAQGVGGGLTLHLADAVVLGTGGYGHLFAATTNPAQVAGAAMAMAARAGIEVADAEFVQFHPTALAVAGVDPLPLLTEALRGEGAVLVNDCGERFMRALHPDAELAPRDIVARGNYAELLAGRHPRLDARAAVGDAFPQRFPTVFALATAAGIDPRRELLPVSPAAHYCMGGVATDADGRTARAGLWVVGEAASTGVHGANRLASNSLLEGVVMGRAAARAIRAGWQTATATDDRNGPTATVPQRVRVARSAWSTIPADDAAELAAIRTLLWEHAGVVRDETGLRAGLAELQRHGAGADGSAGNTVRNALAVAGLVLLSALERTESRGAHFRADHPAADPAQATRRIVRPEPAGSVELTVESAVCSAEASTGESAVGGAGVRDGATMQAIMAA